MTENPAHSQVVQAEGHLIDSQLLNVIFDTVIKWDASFEVLQFTIGRTNDEPSSISMRIASSTEDGLRRVLEELVPLGCQVARASDALVRRADRDGCVPDDFYSTTNLKTLVRHDGRWLEVEGQRMDSVIVIQQGHAICRKLRDVRTGDGVVCGVEGVRA